MRCTKDMRKFSSRILCRLFMFSFIMHLVISSLSLILLNVSWSPSSELNSHETKAMAWRMLWKARYWALVGAFINLCGLSRRDMQQRLVIVFLVYKFDASLMARSTRQPAISFYICILFLSKFGANGVVTCKMWANGKRTSLINQLSLSSCPSPPIIKFL